MRHRPGRGSRSGVHGIAGRERGIHHVADEQVHNARPGAHVAERPLRSGQRSGVVVDSHLETGRGGHDLADRDAAPAQHPVLHDATASRVDPAAGGHTQPQRQAAAGLLGDEYRHAPGEATQQPLRVSVGVADALPRDYPAAQVKQGQGGVAGRDVQAGCHQTTGVDVDGDVRAADAVLTRSPPSLLDQPRAGQSGGQSANRRRRKAGEPGDRASGYRPVVERRPQHRRRARGLAIVSGSGKVTTAQWIECSLMR